MLNSYNITMSLLMVGHSFARRLGDANAEDVFRRKMSVTFSNVTVKGKGGLKLSGMVAMLAAATTSSRQ